MLEGVSKANVKLCEVILEPGWSIGNSMSCHAMGSIGNSKWRTLSKSIWEKSCNQLVMFCPITAQRVHAQEKGTSSLGIIRGTSQTEEKH